MSTLDHIRNVLKTIEDPLMRQSVVTLNMIREITYEGGVAKVSVELKAPDYPFEDELKKAITEAVSKVDGVTSVDVVYATRTMRPPGAQKPVEGVKNVIAVYACKGGVGKSTVSTNLAASLAKAGARVGLLDADIHGPNIPLMMGTSESPKGAEGNRLLPVEAHGIQLMSIGFLTNAKLPSIWRGPMVHGAIQQLLRDTKWDNLDFLIVDFPPGTGDAQLTIIQSAPLMGVVFVTTPQAVSLADGAKGIGLFKKFNIPILGMIENMSGFSCPHCGKETDIFSKGGGEKEAKDLNIPYWGSLPIEPGMVVAGDKGVPFTIGTPDSPSAQTFMGWARNLIKKAKEASPASI